MMNREIRTHATDPRATHFRDAILWLPGLMAEAMADKQPAIRGRTFTNCLIHGPAVLFAVQGVALESCNLGDSGGDMRTLVMRPANPGRLTGAIPVEDCTFEFCDFHNIGFTGAETFVQSILDIRPTGQP